MEKAAQVWPVNKLHGKKERVVLSCFEIATVNYITIAHFAQSSHLAPKAGDEGLVATQLAGEKFEGARFVHEDVLSQINGTKTSLAELTNDAVGLADQHARSEVANLVEQMAMDGAGCVAVGITSVALWAGFHSLDPSFRRFRGTSIVPLCARKRKVIILYLSHFE